ncbi:DUF1345 domain-containing protein [Sphingomonas sp. GlSt437]|uniref:DUF1345 domain-containing protein n=1 Tax=Sphingomonas sp. GlSt437 TaxID=3389970 RepID=UPI003A894C8E
MARHPLALGRRLAPPRFLLFVSVFALSLVLLSPTLVPTRAIMGAFDIAGTIFLISVAPLFNSEPGRMRSHARANDANRALLLLISVLVTLVVLVVVSTEMMARSSRLGVAQVVGTLVLAWLFSNTVYALHYAHLYYSADGKGGDAGGIDFVGKTPEPDYWDFAYFSFTLGMTFQTSDTGISSPRVRRVVLGQSMAAFVFNIGVLALTVNVLGSSAS